MFSLEYLVGTKHSKAAYGKDAASAEVSKSSSGDLGDVANDGPLEEVNGDLTKDEGHNVDEADVKKDEKL